MKVSKTASNEAIKTLEARKIIRYRKLEKRQKVYAAEELIQILSRPFGTEIELALEKAVSVLETFTEYRSVTDEEMDVIGELITNMCGAIEVHKMIDDGMPERDAANNFVKKVLGSIDK